MDQANDEHEMEKVAREYQVLQEQLRSIAMQIDQLKGNKAELERAKEELDKATGKVYISVGGVIVETTKEKAVEEIKDKAELADTRIQSNNRQYTELKAKEKQLTEKITKFYDKGNA